MTDVLCVVTKRYQSTMIIRGNTSAECQHTSNKRRKSLLASACRNMKGSTQVLVMIVFMSTQEFLTDGISHAHSAGSEGTGSSWTSMNARMDVWIFTQIFSKDSVRPSTVELKKLQPIPIVIIEWGGISVTQTGVLHPPADFAAMRWKY